MASSNTDVVRPSGVVPQRSQNVSNGASGSMRVAGTKPTVWPFVLVMYATLLPDEAFVQVGELKLVAYRLALFVTLPFVIPHLMRARLKLGALDVLVGFSGFWMMFAMMVRYDIGTGVERGGVLFFDLVSAYLVGRCYLRSVAAVRRVLTAAAPALAATAALMFVESVSGTIYLKPFVASALGTSLPEFFGARERLGLTRAYGPFPHPILAGVYMISFIPLFVLAMRRGAWRLIGIVSSTFGFFALSSASTINLILNWGLVIFDKLQRSRKSLSWRMFIYAFVSILTAVHLMSNSGVFSIVIRYFTLDPATGFYRFLIWEHGMENVRSNPWIGLGFEEWVRPSWMSGNSVDAHWLATAMRTGLPSSLALFLATVSAIFLLSKVATLSSTKDARNVCVALAISMSVLVVSMFTVTLWSAPLTWFYVLLGGCVGFAKMTERRSIMDSADTGRKGWGGPRRERRVSSSASDISL